MQRFSIPMALAVIIPGLVSSPCLRGAGVMFTIDTSRSQVTLSGTVAGLAMTPQGPGSLTASLSGTINANLTGSDIQFTGQSAIAAITNGIWKPAVGGGSGTAPADYAGKVTVGSPPLALTGYAALRNLVLDVTSVDLPLSGTNFDSSALVFTFVPDGTSTLDYNAITASGSRPLTGDSTNDVVNGASASTLGSTQTLRISINSQFPFSLSSANDTLIRLNGQIIATNSPLISRPPLFSDSAITNNTLVLTAENTGSSAVLQSSSNLNTWTPASATIVTNGQTLIYSLPVGLGSRYFRIQQ